MFADDVTILFVVVHCLEAELTGSPSTQFFVF